MKNWNVLVRLSAEGKNGTQDNWWGVAANETNAKAAAILAMATKHGVAQSEVTALTCSEVKPR